MTINAPRRAKQRAEEVLNGLLTPAIGRLRKEFAAAIAAGPVNVKPQGADPKTLGWAVDIYTAVKVCKTVPYPDLVAAYAPDRVHRLLCHQTPASTRPGSGTSELEVRGAVWDFARNIGFLRRECEHQYPAAIRGNAGAWAKRPMEPHPREFDELCDVVDEYGLPQLRALDGPATGGIVIPWSGERIDLKVGPTLIDTKTVADPLAKFRQYLRQLLGYSFAHQRGEINHMGLYVARRGVLFIRPPSQVVGTDDPYLLKAFHNRYRESLDDDA